MKKVLAFAGSNSSTSINHSLLQGLLKRLHSVEVELIRLTDYPLPMFGEDLERNQGYPDSLQALQDRIKDCDGLIIAVNEHNGTVSAYFKNVLDWLSRIEYKFLNGKKVLLLSTSNGKRGAKTALEYTTMVLPRFDAEIVNSIPVPGYSQVFEKEKGTILDPELDKIVEEALQNFVEAM